MKTSTLTMFKHGAFACATWMALAIAAQAQTYTRFDATPTSRVKIEGTSTIHDWTMEGQVIGGYLELDSTFPTDPALKEFPNLKAGKVAARASANIPVRSLKSGKNAMDEIMQEAMNAPVNPRIEYRLGELTLKEVPKGTDPFKFESTGELVINGVTNKLSMPVTMERVTAMRIRFSGRTPIKMSSYNVKPPSPKLALGAIKTKDEVTVSLDWVIAVKAPSKQ